MTLRVNYGGYSHHVPSSYDSPSITRRLLLKNCAIVTLTFDLWILSVYQLSHDQPRPPNFRVRQPSILKLRELQHDRFGHVRRIT